MYMYGVHLLLILLWLDVGRADQTIVVTSTSCIESASLDYDETIWLQFNGGNLHRICKVSIVKTLRSYGRTDGQHICVYAEAFIISKPDIRVEYHVPVYGNPPDEVFSYKKLPTEEWCTSYSSIVIAFKSTFSASDIALKVYSKSEPRTEATTPAVKSESSTEYIIIMILIAGAMLFLGLVVFIVVRRVCFSTGREPDRSEYAYHATDSNAPGSVTYQTDSAVPKPALDPSDIPYHPQGQGYIFTPSESATGTTPVSAPRLEGYESPQTDHTRPGARHVNWSEHHLGYTEQGTRSPNRHSPHSSPRVEHTGSVPSAPPLFTDDEPPPYPGY